MTPETKDWIDLGMRAATLVVVSYGAVRSYRNGLIGARVEAGVNGQTAKLLKVTGEAEHAKGVKEGQGSADEVVKVKLVDEE